MLEDLVGLGACCGIILLLLLLVMWAVGTVSTYFGVPILVVIAIIILLAVFT